MYYELYNGKVSYRKMFDESGKFGKFFIITRIAKSLFELPTQLETHILISRRSHMDLMLCDHEDIGSGIDVTFMWTIGGINSDFVMPLNGSISGK